MCHAHYQRWYKTGSVSPDVPIRPATHHLTIEQRFWLKVTKDGPIPAHAPHLGRCWQWIGANRGSGYGIFMITRQDAISPHRFAYEALVGPIDDERHQLDHLCRNRACVNPAHLEPVTCRENLLRSPLTLNARNAAKTHCPQGHPYDAENTLRTRDGKRVCRTCARAATRRWWRENRGSEGIRLKDPHTV